MNTIISHLVIFGLPVCALAIPLGVYLSLFRNERGETSSEMKTTQGILLFVSSASSIFLMLWMFGTHPAWALLAAGVCALLSFNIALRVAEGRSLATATKLLERLSRGLIWRGQIGAERSLEARWPLNFEADWFEGVSVKSSGLDEATRTALKQLWLDEAKRKYVNVALFSRWGWRLSQLSAPATMIADLHLAALREIEYAKKCFALAKGFGAESSIGNPLAESEYRLQTDRAPILYGLPSEVLIELCLMMGFSADVSAAGAKSSGDVGVTKVLESMSRDERYHAALGWGILQFCFDQESEGVAQVLISELSKMANLNRPNLMGVRQAQTVRAANPYYLAKFGRLTEVQLGAIWKDRLDLTLSQVRLLMAGETEVLDVYVDRRETDRDISL